MRRLLCHEPRGHADMYGCFLVAARRRRRRPRRAVLAQGRLLDGVRARHDRARRLGGRVGPGRGRPTTARPTCRSTCPSGRVAARVRCAGGARARTSTFRNVPSYVLARDVPGTPRRARARSTSPTAARSTRACRPPRVGLAVEPGRPDGADRRSAARSRARSTRHRARPPPERRRGSPASTGRSSTTSSATGRRAAPAQRDGVRRRRGRPLAVRLGHLRARLALLHADGRLGAAAARSRTSRSSARRSPRTSSSDGRRRGPRRRRHRGARRGLPHRRAPLRARPARPARHRLRAAVSAPGSSTPRQSPAAARPREAVDALEAALRGRPRPRRRPAAPGGRGPRPASS